MADEIKWEGDISESLKRDTITFSSVGDPNTFPQKIELDAVDVLIDPPMRAIPTGIDMSNLYSRPGRFIALDGPPNEAKIGDLTNDDLIRVIDRLYTHGGTPDILYVTPESAHARGLIGCGRYKWLLLKRSVGHWKRNALSGVQSALRTIGLGRTP